MEVNGTEWSFGCCEKGSGVYCCKPRDNPMYAYRETVTLGATTLSEYQVLVKSCLSSRCMRVSARDEETHLAE